LMMALKDHIARTEPSQSEAAKLPGVTQPRISDLMRGKYRMKSSGSGGIRCAIPLYGLNIISSPIDFAEPGLDMPVVAATRSNR
jgi:Helix-turn-helix domain